MAPETRTVLSAYTPSGSIDIAHLVSMIIPILQPLSLIPQEALRINMPIFVPFEHKFPRYLPDWSFPEKQPCCNYSMQGVDQRLEVKCDIGHPTQSTRGITASLDYHISLYYKATIRSNRPQIWNTFLATKWYTLQISHSPPQPWDKVFNRVTLLVLHQEPCIINHST